MNISFKRHPNWYSGLGGAGGDKFSLFYWLLTLRIALPRIRVISAIIGVTRLHYWYCYYKFTYVCVTAICAPRTTVSATASTATENTFNDITFAAAAAASCNSDCDCYTAVTTKNLRSNTVTAKRN